MVGTPWSMPGVGGLIHGSMSVGGTREHLNIDVLLCSIFSSPEPKAHR